MKKLLAISFFVFLGACSSEPTVEKPAWITEPTRIVDNGYIVYVGSGEERDLNQAQLAAEGMAIQDLANECSFIPKGTRIEDRFEDKQKNTYKAYAKVAVEISTCDQASKLTDPVAIKEMASLPFTEELQRFEDSLQDNRDEVVESGIPVNQLSSPQNGGSGGGNTTVIVGNTGFFMARQYVVYQNQAVIMAPPGAYAPGTPAAQAYATNVRPVIGHVQTYAAQNPQMRTNPPTWSSMSSQVRAEHPQSFSAPRGGGRSMRAPNPGRPQGQPRQQRGQHSGRRRRQGF